MNVARFTTMLLAAAKGVESARTSGDDSPTSVASAVLTSLDAAGFRVSEKQPSKAKAA